MKKFGIIFDMDGTLWDSSEGVAASWTEVVGKEYPGIDGLDRENETDMKNNTYSKKDSIPPVITREKIQSVMGLTMDKLAEAVFPELSEDTRMKLLEKCCASENAYLEKNGGSLYPEVEKTLMELKERYHLYIVSNCQSGYIEAFLKYYGFGSYFDDIECYGNNNLKKGDNIRLIVSRNNLDEAWYVGDIQGDYEASMYAGVSFIHAAYGFGEINQEVPKIKEFAELSSLMRNLSVRD